MASKKLKDLDINNLYQLNNPAKFTLAGLVILAVLALGYAGLFRGQIESLDSAEQKEIELKKTYTKKSIEAASLNNLKAELTSIRSAFHVLLKQLPTDAEIPTLIQELNQAGASNGLRLDSVVPQAAVNDGPIQKLPYEIAITGKYSQLAQFTRDVGDLSRIITLESLQITQANTSKTTASGSDKNNANNGLLTLSATANTYKARPADEVAAELEQMQAAAQEEKK